ncbi:MAG: aminopeptidase [Clostridia bacterium]
MTRDSRIEKLAGIVVGYSLGVEKGKNVMVDSFDHADDFAAAMVREIFKAGAYPFVNHEILGIKRELILGMGDEYLERLLDIELYKMKKMDYYIGIRKNHNINELSCLPQGQLYYMNALNHGLHYEERVKNTRWTVMRYPNPQMAQLAGMGTEAFQDYYFHVCCLDYQYLSQCMVPLKELMDHTDKVRIVARDTDLTFSIEGHTGGICDGHANLPDGEVCTGPVQGSMNGTIRYNVPSTTHGITFNDICFEIEKGKIVKATSSDTPALNRILDLDEGARGFGEFAIGTNPYIDKSINDILFDEKMTGSIHLTPGNGWGNKSSIHWDIVQSHLPMHGGGEIWFDGMLVRKDGLFLPESLKPLNPDVFSENRPTVFQNHLIQDGK